MFRKTPLPNPAFVHIDAPHAFPASYNLTWEFPTIEGRAPLKLNLHLTKNRESDPGSFNHGAWYFDLSFGNIRHPYDPHVNHRIITLYNPAYQKTITYMQENMPTVITRAMHSSDLSAAIPEAVHDRHGDLTQGGITPITDTTELHMNFSFNPRHVINKELYSNPLTCFDRAKYQLGIVSKRVEAVLNKDIESDLRLQRFVKEVKKGFDELEPRIATLVREGAPLQPKFNPTPAESNKFNIEAEFELVKRLRILPRAGHIFRRMPSDDPS